MLRDKTHHLRIEALLVDLASYNATYGEGDALQQLWVEALEGGARGMQEAGEEPIQLPTYQHEDKTLRYPAKARPIPQKVTAAPHITGFFDGGAAKRKGTGGFVVFGSAGECITAQGEYYGEEVETNNRAEILALVGLMQWLVQHPGEWEGQAIIIFGDSELII